ncbi:FAD binding domain-containing protein [Mucor mucedo]|uniref:FAD binding domain-containing protein n=1 Tax=Mucor mucedo TaxID=29922 RepID=UPI00221E8DF2|nr:FAD binding domain-containing protein [Mucor mucedo]KAI7892421.1 FAD binding domain-containing protein [Mucor mucedo]
MYERDVFIAGSGVSGLYAAIVLSKIGVSVHIATTTKDEEGSDEVLVFSPRSLQLLSQLDLLSAMTQHGIRHYKFEVYQNKGIGNHAVTQLESLRLWENDVTEYNYALSCPKSIVLQILKEYLEKVQGIPIDQDEELIHIEEQSNPSSLSNAELSLYYQYRPLPVIHHALHDRTMKSIHLRHRKTKEVKVHKALTIIGADGQTSLVRQKLGLSLVSYQSSQQNTRWFYTLVIDIISTTYPGVRQIATMSKNKNILFILGHQTHLYITFEHKSSWSKVSIDDEIPLSLALRHIKTMMEPYLVEFGKPRSYKKWNGNNISSCENHTMDSSYFLIGSASQRMTPPGLVDINTNLEQVQNLCWKLALGLQHCASPKLLETFEQESRYKVTEALHFSTVITNLMGDYYLHQKHDPLHARDIVYELTRFKSCIIGTTPLLPNILNHASEEDDDTSSILAPSFEFMAPNTTVSMVDHGGCLAPNAKLKPYTLFQLLLTTSQTNKQQQVTQIDPSNSTTSTTTTNIKPRRRSNSVTSSTSIWSSIPLFQKSPKKRSPLTPTTPTTPTAVVAVDRWKSIKANHLQLLDRIQSFNKTGCTFTILLFCGSMEETQAKVGTFVRLMESPGSFIYRYERGGHLTTIGENNNNNNNNRNSVISFDGVRRSVDQPRRESFESFLDHTRFSTSSMSSSSAGSSLGVISNRLFNVIFISSSGRNDAVKYLNNTPPATVHSTFPCGLSQVFLDHDGQCYKAYHVGKENHAVVIRPDGYIGTRVSIENKEEEAFERINRYFDSFLRPPVDMNTAAAVVAADYE